MQIPVISIGNSKGIRLSKTIVKRYNITDHVELILEKKCIIIKPKSSPRAGWDKAFQNIHDHGEDRLLMPDVFKDENPEAFS